MRLRSGRFLAASMSGLVGKKGPQILASPRTADPLFRRIEEVHDERGQPYGHILDAGTGGHSLKWLGTLPDAAVTSVTAVTADASAGEGKGAMDARAALQEARGDALVEGKWCVPGAAPPLKVAKFDTVLCDYLIGSMDGFTPFEQDSFFEELKPLCAPDALVHVVGLNPVYAQLGSAAKLDDKARVVVDTARLRDACILLAGHRPYREFPPTWIVRHLEKSGFAVLDPWKSYGVVWKHATVKKQLDVARRKLKHFDDPAVAAAMATQIDALDARAKDVLGDKGAIYGYDYVISARLTQPGDDA